MMQGMRVGCAIGMAALALTAGCSTRSLPVIIVEEGPPSPAAVEMFNGRDLGGWKAVVPAANKWMTAAQVGLDPQEEAKLKAVPGSGILLNAMERQNTNLYSVLEHGDCELHIEFMVPKGSNSGVYFQGRYEIQVFDSFGQAEVTFSDCGGIYARWINEQNVEGHQPRVNASRAPGEWQSFDAKFTAPRFDADGKKTANARFDWVRHNGVMIHENLELNGPTRAAMDETTEMPRGPIMLQGDHGPVAYRNLSIRLLK